VTSHADTLSTDPDALRELLLAERARHAETIARIAQERDAAVGESVRLRAMIQALQRHRFGRRSEQLDLDQLALGLEDTEQGLSAAESAARHRHAWLTLKLSRPAVRILSSFGEPRRGRIACPPRHLPRASGHNI
jgi:hypothetical protein